MISNSNVIVFLQKEPMDTTESMKSDTPQPSAKEPSPQKEQADNNIAGMCRMNAFVSLSHIFFFFQFLSTVQEIH